MRSSFSCKRGPTPLNTVTGAESECWLFNVKAKDSEKLFCNEI
jgi:hypothetical protein